MNVLGKRIRELREERQMSQKELSEKLNISTPTMSQYETGARVPSDDIKIRISNFFGVSIDYLLGLTNLKNDSKNNDFMYEFPEGVDVLRRSTQELSPKAREVMIKHMNQFIDDLKEMDSKKDED